MGRRKSLHAHMSLNSAVLIGVASMKPLSGWSGPAVSLKPKPDQKVLVEQDRSGVRRTTARLRRTTPQVCRTTPKFLRDNFRVGPDNWARQGAGGGTLPQPNQRRASCAREASQGGQPGRARPVRPGQPGRPRPGGPGQGGGQARRAGHSPPSRRFRVIACLSHAPAPEPVLGLLRCACRVTDASARSLLLLAAPAARSSLGFRV